MSRTKEMDNLARRTAMVSTMESGKQCKSLWNSKNRFLMGGWSAKNVESHSSQTRSSSGFVIFSAKGKHTEKKCGNRHRKENEHELP